MEINKQQTFDGYKGQKQQSESKKVRYDTVTESRYNAEVLRNIYYTDVAKTYKSRALVL